MTIKVNKAQSKGLSLTEIALNDLVGYENNPRENDAAVPDMMELISTFGFRVPILVRGTRIVDGHLRVKAAADLGMETVPAIEIGDMSEAEERALRIAVNKSVEWADWDEDKLRTEFDFLIKEGFDLKMTGFDEVDVAKIASNVMADAAQKKVKDGDAGTAADPNAVSVIFHMTAEKRDKLIEALDKVMKKHNLSNRSQALQKAILG